MSWLIKAPLAAGVLAGASLLLAQPAAADVLVNGGFEDAVTTDPWVASGGIGFSALGTAKATDGVRVGLIGFNTVFGAASGAISQAFSTANAGQFNYAFDAGRAEQFCQCQDVALTFEARIDGALLSNALPTYDPSGGGAPVGTGLLSHYQGSLMLDAGAHQFTFAFSRGESGFGRAPFFLLDAVQGTSLATPSTPGGVPEPGTWALMIAGLGGAGVALRRRRARLA